MKLYLIYFRINEMALRAPLILSLLSFWVGPTHFLCYINILLIKHTNVNSTSLYLKKAGLASRNIVYLLKFHLCCIGLCFYIFIFIC